MRRDIPRKIKITKLEVKSSAQLMEFLQASLPNKSRNTVKSILAHRQVTVNGKVITQFDFLIKRGNAVEIVWGKVPQQVKYRGLKILFEDEYLLVIDKEAGLLSIATEKEKTHTAYNIVSKHVKSRVENGHIFILHRLDKETSGVMMFAKDKEIQSQFQRNWKDTVVDRSYVAVVEGSVKKETDMISSWMRESESSLKMHSSHQHGEGQKAETFYRVMRKSRNYTMLEVKIQTGRKNQIRVHMQDIGHPVAGDKKYGAQTNPIRRLALHAHKLSFIHPITKERKDFESPIPAKLRYLTTGEGPQ